MDHLQRSHGTLTHYKLQKNRKVEIKNVFPILPCSSGKVPYRNLLVTVKLKYCIHVVLHESDTALTPEGV